MLGLFGIILVCSTVFLPSVRPEDKIILAQTWSQRAIIFFGMLIAVFISSMSIPDDIEEKKLFMVLTKPIPRRALVIGKYIGFAVVMAAFLLVMGVLSIIYIRLVNMGAEGVNISPRRAVYPVEMRFASPDNNSSALFGSFSEEEKASVSFTQGAVSNREYAEWIFRGIDPGDYDETVKAVFRFRVLKNNFPANSLMKVMFSSAGEKPEVEPYVTAKEFYYKKEIEVEFNRKSMGSGREFKIALRRTDRRTSFEGQFDSVYILSSKSSFELNYFKGLGITFFGMLLIMGITTAASTVLSGPVNLLLGVFLYLSGSMLEFFKQALADMQLSIRALEVSGYAGHGADDQMPVWLMKVSDAISSFALDVIPDISRFDATSYMLKNLDISPQVFAGSLSYAVSYAFVAMVCAFVVIAYREFK